MGVSPQTCLNDSFFARIVAGDAEPAERLAALAHADGCERCRGLLAAVLMPADPSEAPDASSDALEPTMPRLAGSRTPVEVGDRVDHYTVLGVLGRGSYGVVVHARDDKLGRDVALKLLHPGPGLDDRRLMREAQAMARLTHPNVVMVHGAGVTDHGVYVAMEMVDGTTLTGWMAQSREWSQIVDMWIDAGRGLAAAHDAGLVHRDFKPDNVLVGSDGGVLVTDFGLAAAPGYRASQAERAAPEDELSQSLTQTGAIVGTPRYMSPEQMRGGDVDARADQFAFGVSLYRAVYGEFPYSGRNFDDLVDSVCSGAVRQPPDDTVVPIALWSVLQRCIAQDADARYPDMHAVLAELEALRGVRGRRRRWLMVSAIGVVGVGAGIVFGRQLEQRPCHTVSESIDSVWSERRRASVRDALGSQEHAGIAGSAERAVRSLDVYAAQWSTLREDVCRTARIDRAAPEALRLKQVQCLDERQRHLAATIDVLSAPATNLEVALHAASVIARLPDLEDCRSATFVSAQMPPPGDERVALRALAVEDDLAHGVALLRVGNTEAAGALVDAAVANALEIQHAPLTVRALTLQARVRAAGGSFDAALESVRAAYVVSDGASRFDVARNHQTMGALLSERGQITDALIELRKARTLDESLGITRPSLLDDLGRAHRRAGEYERSLELHEAAHAALVARFGPRGIAVLNTELDIAVTQSKLGRYADAVATTEAGLAIARASLGEGHPRVVSLLINHATFDMERAEPERALKTTREAIAWAQTSPGGHDKSIALARAAESSALALLGRLPEALEVGQQALDATIAAYGPQHPKTAGAHNNLARTHLYAGDNDKAIAGFRRASELWIATGGDHPEVWRAMTNIAAAELALGRYAEAVSDAKAALEGSAAHRTEDNIENATAVAVLGAAAFALGDCEASYDALTRALRIQRKVLPAKHPEPMVIVDKLGFLLQRAGRFDDAIEQHRLALTMRAEALGAGNPVTVATRLGLAIAKARAGHGADAAAELETARQAMGASPPWLTPMLSATETIVATPNSPPRATVDGLATARSTLQRQGIIEWTITIDDWVAGPAAPSCPIPGL